MAQTKRVIALAIAALFIIGAFTAVAVTDNNLSVADNNDVKAIPTLDKMNLTSDAGITSANQQMVENNVGTVTKTDDKPLMTVTGDFAIDVGDGTNGITISNGSKIHINGSHKIVFNFAHESAGTGGAFGIYGNDHTYVSLFIEGTDKTNVLTIEANCTGGEFSSKSSVINAYRVHVNDCTINVLIKSGDDSKLNTAVTGGNLIETTNSEVIVRDAADGKYSHISESIIESTNYYFNANSCVQISSHDHTDGTYPQLLGTTGAKKITSTGISFNVSDNPDAKFKQMMDIGTSPTVDEVNGYRALIAGVPSLIDDDNDNNVNTIVIALVITLLVVISSFLIVIYGKRYE